MAKIKVTTGLSIGPSRLPGNVRIGSKAYWNKEFTSGSRTDMAAVVDRFANFLQGIENANADALEIALAPTFDKAVTYCPVDSGKLVNSADIQLATKSDGSAVCRISFGGKGDVHYAAIVHERTDLHHHAPTRSKFLQAAVEEDLRSMKRRYTLALKSLLGIK